MALQLDLEEQEQLAQIKHFWKQYGDLITWGLVLIMGVFAAVNGWNYWQRSQASNASILFEEVNKALASKDADKVERAFADMKDKFGGTTLAHQAGLLSAKALLDLNKPDQAQAALVWVADKASDEGHQAIAKLRLSALYLDKKAYDEALKALSGIELTSFLPLVADRKGDILMAQGQTAAAKAEYEKAYKTMEDENDYRRLVEAKLNALGVDASLLKAAPVATSEGKK
jgi:predicted negative regulator of RcsB-dependent stress response